LSDPVPWADRIAQSALKAESEGVSTGIFYLVDDLFERSDCFHCLYQSSFFGWLMPVQKRGILVEIKACEKFYRRHIVDIPRIKF
jgi:hypothetical protein